MGVTRYLADRSALARLHLAPVSDVLVPLMDRGLVSICGVTEPEMLFSARNAEERRRVKEQLAAATTRTNTPHDVWSLASDIQEALTENGLRRSASIADLIIAATARASELTVLHYDADFDTIAGVTDQPTKWVVPAGTGVEHLPIAGTQRLPPAVPGKGPGRLLRPTTPAAP